MSFREKLNAAALEASEARLRQVFARGPVPQMVLQVDGTLSIAALGPVGFAFFVARRGFARAGGAIARRAPRLSIVASPLEP